MDPQNAWRLFKEYWELALLVATWLGVGVVWLRRRWDWARRRFDERVNFSLTYVDRTDPAAPRLLLRTLTEESAQDVWRNAYGVAQVKRAAARTTALEPLLSLPDAEQQGVVNRGALNLLAGLFPGTFVGHALGQETGQAEFVFGLTFERYGRGHDDKLRVIVVQEQTLRWLFEQGGDKQVAFEVPTHSDRVDTLRSIYDTLRAGNPSEQIGRVVLGVG